MSTPIINYLFKDGKIENVDHSLKGSLSNGVCKSVSVTTTGWERLENSIELSGPKSFIRVPATEELKSTDQFAVEMVIKPTRIQERMNLIVGQVIPFSLYLKKVNNHYNLAFELNIRNKWIEVVGSNYIIPLGAWTAVAIVFTGDDIFLFANGKLVIRRILQNAELQSTIGSEEFVVGTSNDETKHQFRGEVAGLRIWDTIPEAFLTLISDAEMKGIGEIESKYAELGGENSFLKKPKGPERIIAGGRYREYQGGNIYWSVETGTHEVHGEILQNYLKYKSVSGPLGFPKSDQLAGKKAGVSYNKFARGAIYHSVATGAHDVRDLIYARYIELGAEKSFLGLPISDSTYRHGGQKNDFQNGAIYFSPTSEAHEVHGEILKKYVKLGETGRFLGYPLSDESIIYNEAKRPTAGRLSRFQGGTIYWSPSSGAYEVHGDIRETYENMGGPLSQLGYPISDEATVSGTSIRYNDFQKGIMIWQPGIGVKVVTGIRLHLGYVKSSKIDDGIDWFKKDKSAELVTYTTLKVNGNMIQNNKRRPSGHAGTSYDINYSYTIQPVRHDTSIYLKIKVDDWDLASKNDYLGTLERTFTIRNMWALTGGYQGVYTGVPCTKKGGDAPKLSSITFDFSLQPTRTWDVNKHFREQGWWAFDNFKTQSLTRQQYADTFRDVEIAEDWWDKLLSPFDTIYYETLYEDIAKNGNCFGMSLEAVYALVGRSLLVEPLIQYKSIGNKCAVNESDVPAELRSIINLKHGYQLGASAFRWLIGRLVSLEAIRPLSVYERVKHFLRSGDYPIVTMNDISDFRGHAVQPYKCVDGAGNAPHRIYVCDPNVPWCSKTGDTTYIEINKNNTFRFVGGTTSYQSTSILGNTLPGTLLLEFPFHVLSNTPRTPFWEILLGLITLIGGIVLIAGDAETTQISANNKNFYKKVGGKKEIEVNAIPNMVRVPIQDAPNGVVVNRTPSVRVVPGVFRVPLRILERTPELYIQRGPPANEMQIEVEGKKKGKYVLLFQTKTNVVSVESPISSQTKDIINFEKIRTSKPLIKLTSKQEEKNVKIKYGIIKDSNGRDYRRLSADVKIVKDKALQVGAAPRGGGFSLSSEGPSEAINVVIERFVNNQMKGIKLTHTMPEPSQTIKIRPPDWTLSKKEVVIDRMSRKDGSVIERMKKLGT